MLHSISSKLWLDMDLELANSISRDISKCVKASCYMWWNLVFNSVMLSNSGKVVHIVTVSWSLYSLLNLEAFNLLVIWLSCKLVDILDVYLISLDWIRIYMLSISRNFFQVNLDYRYEYDWYVWLYLKLPRWHFMLS